MKVLRVVARVYDTKTREYVQRGVELPVSEEVVKGIQDAIHPEGATSSPLRTFGHGSTRYDKRYCEDVVSTPLRDQRRYLIDPQLLLFDLNEETGEYTENGGWSGM